MQIYRKSQDSDDEAEKVSANKKHFFTPSTSFYNLDSKTLKYTSN